jgi:hypothetical protein
MNMKFARVLRRVETIAPGGRQFPSFLHPKTENARDHFSPSSLISVHHSNALHLQADQSLEFFPV